MDFCASDEGKFTANTEKCLCAQEKGTAKSERLPTSEAKQPCVNIFNEFFIKIGFDACLRGKT